MKEIKLTENLCLHKIASFGDDFGSHSETVFFCYEIGFILAIDDIRIETLFYRIDKDEFLKFMADLYEDHMLYCDVDPDDVNQIEEV